MSDHLVGRGHLEVQLDVGQVAQAVDIVVLDVAAIFAQVHGDAVGTAEMGFDGRPDGIGFIGAARLTDGRHMIDIDAEFNHSSCNSTKIRRDCKVWPPR